MSISKLYIIDETGLSDLPNWVKLAFTLGSYVYDIKSLENKTIKIMISLPTELFFAQLIAMGIADKKFSTKKEDKSIREQILSLKKGDRIIYQDKNSARRVSVLSVESNIVFKDEKVLKVSDGGGLQLSIPEKNWINKITLLNEEYDEVKRSMRVGKNHKGLNENLLLKELYTKDHLNKISFYPGEYFYIVGNIAQQHDLLEETIFRFKNLDGSIKDFIYIDNKSGYQNGSILSSRSDLSKIQIEQGVPVIFSDLNSYIKQNPFFRNNPQIIVTSRNDTKRRLDIVNNDLKRMYLQQEMEIITEKIIDHVKYNNIIIPHGIEIFAWR